MTRGTRIMQEPIKEFRNEYRFLSNYYRSPFEIGNVTYPTVEHYFQAAKAIYREDFLFVLQAPTPAEAKRRGRSLQIRSNWEQDKEIVMRAALVHKFAPETRMATLLIETGIRNLIEGNVWGDTYWGFCRGRGQNRLGILLMERRTELRRMI